MQHTQTPWTVRRGDEIEAFGYMSGEVVALCVGYDHVARRIDGEERKANAEFIVKACNNHEKLVQLVLDLWLESSDDLYEQSGAYYDLKQRVEEIANLQKP